MRFPGHVPLYDCAKAVWLFYTFHAMKESSFGRIAFGVSVALTMIFTLISLLTPGKISFVKLEANAIHTLNK